jgi:hypothetical protein
MRYVVSSRKQRAVFYNKELLCLACLIKRGGSAQNRDSKTLAPVFSYGAVQDRSLVSSRRLADVIAPPLFNGVTGHPNVRFSIHKAGDLVDVPDAMFYCGVSHCGVPSKRSSARGSLSASTDVGLACFSIATQAGQ